MGSWILPGKESREERGEERLKIEAIKDRSRRRRGLGGGREL